jgi:hypothetical protein
MRDRSKRVLRALRALAIGPAARFPLVAVRLARGRTSHTAAEYACLVHHARGRHVIVELGVHEGVGTKQLRTAMSPTGALYAVDPFPPGRFGVSFPRAIARLETRRVRNGTVTWLRSTDVEAAPIVALRAPGGVELVFSDALLTWAGLEQTWAAWRSLIAPSGIFVQSTSQPIGDRPAPDHPAVRFTRDVLTQDPDFELVEVADAFTVFRRRTPDR